MIRKLILLLAAVLFSSLPAIAQQVASDNFVRADGGLGANWTTMDTAPAIVSNLATGSTSSGSESNGFWNANSFSNDQYSQFTIKGINAGFGVNVRASGTGASSIGYNIIYFPGSGIFLYWESSSATYNLITSNATTLAVNDVVMISVVGTTLTVCKNGSSVLTTTDSHYASGKPGINFRSTTDTANNWSGGNMSVAGCTIPSSSIIKRKSPGIL